MQKFLSKLAITGLILGSMVGIAQAATSPATANECKNGGWKTFTAPAFKNQGQCVSYVEHLKKNPPQTNNLTCFSGPTDLSIYGGTCSITNGVATLNNSDSNPNGDYSGVYYPTNASSGQLLSSITSLGYTYSGTVSPTPGDLSLNIPVDTDINGTTDAYAFVDAFYCPGTAGTVDVIHDPVCGIWVNSIEYPNWAALIAANPTWKVSSDVPFIVAERTPSEPSAVWTVSNVQLGQ